MRRRQLTSIGNIACCERKERGHFRPSLFDRVSKGQLNGLLMNARLDEPMTRTRSVSIEQSIISQRYLHHNMDSKHLWQGTGSFQLRYGADAKSTTAARTDTTSSESYVSNVSIRVFGSTGELDNRGFGNLGRGTRSISLDPAKAKHFTVRPWADC